MAGTPALQALAIQAARSQGIDPQIFLRQINQESGFNPNARSGAGAEGIAQFMPGTAAGMGVNPMDPRSALFGAARLDARNLQAFHGDWRQALAAYNAGGGNASKWNDPSFAGGQTYNYVRDILGGKNIPVAKGGGGVPTAGGILAQAGGSAQGASMRDALLGMVMANNQALMQGQTPSSANFLQVLSALRSGQMGAGGQGAADQLLGAQGANGAAAAGLPQAKPGSVVAAARGMLGTPYVWGGNQPGKALDCSGFLQQSYAKIGVQIPRTTYDQFKVGQKIGLNNLQPGDAVFVEPGKNGPNHVGMYVGNGMVQESPHTGDINKLIPLKQFLGDGYVGARRYVKS